MSNSVGASRGIRIPGLLLIHKLVAVKVCHQTPHDNQSIRLPSLLVAQATGRSHRAACAARLSIDLLSNRFDHGDEPRWFFYLLIHCKAGAGSIFVSVQALRLRM